MHNKRLLMISTDRKVFEKGSGVFMRQAEYAKDWEEVHIIVFSKRSSPLSEISIAPNCWAYPTKSRTKWLYTLDAIRLGKFIISGRKITDITCQDPFLTAMVGISLKKQFNLPLELQVHTDIGSPNFTYTLPNKIRKSLALSYLPKADSIRVVSQKIKNYLVNTLQIDNSKIFVKPVPVNTEWIKNNPVIEQFDLHKKYPKFKKIILMVSRLEKEKNIEMAIKAFDIVLKNSPQSGLIIVGDGSQGIKLKSLVRELRLDNNVIFEPWSDRAKLVSYYKTCDIYLLTSLFEGYGMTLVEAHAAGCEIISTDVGVAGEMGAKIVGWSEKELGEFLIE